MIKKDYEKEREKQLINVKKGSKLLLHSCCAPCSSGVIYRLVDHFDVTVFFYNPNIDTKEEYDKRAEEQIRYVNQEYADKVKVVVCDYEKEEYLKAICGLENQPEGGLRCNECFKLRFDKCAEYAKNNGFDYVTTTLTVSPYKNAPLINEIGEKVCADNKVTWIFCDFKKSNGYLNSINNSKKHGLYRQDYCGCEFSYLQSLNRKSTL